VNNVRVPAQNLQISPNSVNATLNLAEGLNKLLLSAADTDSKMIFSQPTLWVGSRTLNVGVVDENNQPLTGATVEARLGDDQTVKATAISTAGGVVFTNLPNRTIILEAKASGNRFASLATAGGSGSVQLRLTTFNPVSPVDNNDFSQGPSGWDTGTAPVQIIPHDEGIFVPIGSPALKQPSTGVSTFSVAGQQPSRAQKYELFRANRALRNRLARAANKSVSASPFATDPDNDLVLNTQGEGPQRISRTFQAPVGALEARVRYKFVTSEVPGGYFGTQYNDSYSISIRTQNGGQVVNEQQTMNALGLSTFDTNGATDWRVADIPLSGNGDVIQIDLSVANVADGAFDSQLIVDVVGTPSVRFGDLSGVVRDNAADIDITVAPSNPPKTVTLSLKTISGGGKAVFAANNSDTLVINQSGKIKIQGITESSQRDNIRLQATIDGKKANETDELLSVVWVNIEFRNSGSFSQNNAGLPAIVAAMGQNLLGTYRSSGKLDPYVRTVVEIVGTVSPKDFQDKVILTRTKSLAVYLGEGIPYGLNPDQQSPGDLSFGIFRDDVPSPDGKIYDYDAPGIGALSPDPRNSLRFRGNFKQFAVVGGQPNDASATVIDGTQASSELPWFTRTSVITSPGGDIPETSIPGDNQSGGGVTALTWNLQ
jgi:hypothetical protein